MRQRKAKYLRHLLTQKMGDKFTKRAYRILKDLYNETPRNLRNNSFS